MAEKSEAKEDEANKLASRLINRIKGEGKPLKGKMRLGDRLGRDRRDKKEMGERRATDFFEEFEKLSELYPELKGVKVSELKQVLSQVGMSHPDEVVEVLRSGEFRSELKKMKDKWITY